MKIKLMDIAHNGDSLVSISIDTESQIHTSLNGHGK